MKAKIIIKDDKKNRHYLVTIDFTDCSREEVIDIVKYIENRVAHLEENNVPPPEVIIAVPVVIPAGLPFGIIYVDKEMLQERCTFLGISFAEHKTFLPYCMNYERIDIPSLIFIGIHGVNSHFKNVFGRIGHFSKKDFKELLTCSKEIYLVKYYEQIETTRCYIDTTYRKQRFN